MRRKEKQINSKEEIEQLIKECTICRIALFDNNYPYIIPMNYGYKNNCLYFHCALEGKKLDLIKKNNKVGFEIEKYHKLVKHDKSCNWTTQYCSIIGNGEIELIFETNSKIEGLNIIMQHHGKQHNEYNDKALEKVLIMKLKINDLSAKGTV